MTGSQGKPLRFKVKGRMQAKTFVLLMCVCKFNKKETVAEKISGVLCSSCCAAVAYDTMLGYITTSRTELVRTVSMLSSKAEKTDKKVTPR